MWSGSIATIPDGFALCDGNNGTPDLRNRFIVGAGQDSSTSTHIPGINGIGSGYYRPGNYGGEDTHKLSISEIPSHNHSITVTNNYSRPDSSVPGKGTGGDPYTNNGYVGYTGGDQPHENRPPYFALAYIMKL